jgi:hypothetical protein
MAITFTDTSMLDKLQAVAPRLGPAAMAIASASASELRSYMQCHRPWTDRTGKAKVMLDAVASKPDENTIRVTLVHGVSYGIWLELAHEQKYAIIKPTMQAKSNEYFQQYQKLLEKVFGS